MPLQVLVSAGEISGDQMAAPVVASLGAALPGARFFGAGGMALAEQGVEVRHPVERLAVTGLTEALSRVGAAATMAADLLWQARRRGARLALLVDYPGVNTRLAGLLRRAGVPVLYYGAPQRWAWRASGAAALARRVDQLAVTLPFEEAWFRRRGVRATFVGHPLLDRPGPTPAEARERLGLRGSAPVVALLPGSRQGEVDRHLPLLQRTLPLLPTGAVTLLGEPPGGLPGRGSPPGLRRAPSALALGAADLALCASGTVTLQAALAGVPAVVFYRLSRLSHAVARRVIQVPWVSLPNLILGRELLPELLQEQMTPRALAEQARRLLWPAEARRVRRGYAELEGMLGRPGVAGRVADLGLSLLGVWSPGKRGCRGEANEIEAEPGATSTA